MPNGRTQMSERKWVTFLYKIRGHDLPQEVFDYEGIEL